VLGLVRMFGASQYDQAAKATGSAVFMALEGALLIVALVLTFHGYRRGAGGVSGK
jgi:hypothetical protein